MTFENFESFYEWLKTVEGVTIQETSFPQDPTQYVTIEDIRDMDPIVLLEVVLSAYDSSFTLGSFFADRYNGELTIYD